MKNVPERPKSLLVTVMMLGFAMIVMILRVPLMDTQRLSFTPMRLCSI